MISPTAITTIAFIQRTVSRIFINHYVGIYPFIFNFFFFFYSVEPRHAHLWCCIYGHMDNWIRGDSVSAARRTQSYHRALCLYACMYVWTVKILVQLRTQLLTYEIIRDVFSLNRSLSGHTTTYIKQHIITFFFQSAFELFTVCTPAAFFFSIFVCTLRLTVPFRCFFFLLSISCLPGIVLSDHFIQSGASENNRRCPNTYISWRHGYTKGTTTE